MKNIIFSFVILLNSINFSYSQVPSLNLNLEKDKNEEMVMQHNDIKLTIGNLNLNAPFLYKGEVTPFQGYLVKLNSYIKIQKIVEGCQTSCDVLIESIKLSYEEKLSQCQIQCDERINIISSENDLLKIDKNKLEKDLSSEQLNKYIWTTASFTAGVGLGILVYSFSIK